MTSLKSRRTVGIGELVAVGVLGTGECSYLLQLRWRRDNVAVPLSPTGCGEHRTFWSTLSLSSFLFQEKDEIYLSLHT